MRVAPYILVKSSVPLQIGVCFAVIDGFYFQARCSKTAFALVYASHYVLNLKYEKSLNVFFNFVDCLMEIKGVNQLLTVRRLLEKHYKVNAASI